MVRFRATFENHHQLARDVESVELWHRLLTRYFHRHHLYHMAAGMMTTYVTTVKLERPRRKCICALRPRLSVPGMRMAGRSVTRNAVGASFLSGLL